MKTPEIVPLIEVRNELLDQSLAISKLDLKRKRLVSERCRFETIVLGRYFNQVNPLQRARDCLSDLITLSDKSKDIELLRKILRSPKDFKIVADLGFEKDTYISTTILLTHIAEELLEESLNPRHPTVDNHLATSDVYLDNAVTQGHFVTCFQLYQTPSRTNQAAEVVENPKVCEALDQLTCSGRWTPQLLQNDVLEAVMVKRSYLEKI